MDFRIISDDTSYKGSLPKNVKIINKSLDDISHLASSKLGFLASINSPYKLCDFKPAYGLIFSELTSGYEFWGHGDIDVIYGAIRNFISDDILNDYDLICVRHDYLTGYFQLFRNNPRMNSIFTESKDYQAVFQSDRHFCFDETNFQFNSFAEGKSFNEIPSEVESMMHVVKRLQSKNEIRAFFDFFVVEGIPGNLKWRKGRLFFRKKYEILLYHMIHFKKKYSPRRAPKNIPNEFTISKNKIYHKTLK